MSALTIEPLITKHDLLEAARARRVSDLRYWEMVRTAKEQGWSNCEIARVLGVTEAAIRLYWVRHPQLVAISG